MSKICIVDPICRNNAHYIFNLSILYYFKSKKLEEGVLFFSYESNSNIISDCNELGIDVFKINDKGTYIKNVIGFFLRFILNRKFLFAKRVVLLTIDNTILPILFIFNFFLLPFLYKKMIIVSHNNLYTLKTNSIKRSIFKLFLNMYKPKVLLLSPSFANEFKEITDYKRVFGFFHQNFRDLLLQYKNIRIDANFSNPHKTIFIAKSYTEPFFRLYNKINFDNVSLGKKKITVKYVSDKNIHFKENSSIMFERIDVPKDIDKYLNLINTSDFVFLPEDYIANHRASGVLMDSLSLKTNFIAPNVGHFNDILKTFGIGNLYTNKVDFLKILHDIANDVIKSEIDEKKIQTLLKETDPSLIGRFLYS